MLEYIKFWMAKSLSELAIALPILIVFVALAFWAQRKGN